MVEIPEALDSDRSREPKREPDPTQRRGCFSATSSGGDQWLNAEDRAKVPSTDSAKVASGGYGGGRPPFGWRAEGKELAPDERGQEIVAFMRQLSGEGLSSRQIAARLEEAGYRPKVGEHWSSVQVLRVIQRKS